MWQSLLILRHLLGLQDPTRANAGQQLMELCGFMSFHADGGRDLGERQQSVLEAVLTSGLARVGGHVAVGKSETGPSGPLLVGEVLEALACGPS